MYIYAYTYIYIYINLYMYLLNGRNVRVSIHFKQICTYMYIYVYIYIYIYMYIYGNPDVSTILVDFRGSRISCALLCGRGVDCMLFARMHKTHLDLSYIYVRNPEDAPACSRAIYLDRPHGVT